MSTPLHRPTRTPYAPTLDGRRPNRRDFCTQTEREDHRVVHSLSAREAILHARGGAHADSIHARQLLLDARRRPAADTPARFTLTTDVNAHGVRRIELVDAHVPVTGADQFIYLRITVGQQRLDRVRADDGTDWTAILPASHARGGFVSLREATNSAFLFHFSPHIDHLSNRWTVLLQRWDPATGAYADYPLTDDTDAANNPAFVLEIAAFHA